ncbi:MAG: ATP-binding domain-containing protein [Rhodocyclaceae bacterium]|nr:ATP-binding domain-containing protein [Rhodocyclaceae bacterium]MBX3669480.1 ATP-binding domain-containing protein [Rhodocyclaceae bacterium]
MAQVIPTGWRQLSAFGAAQRELETLAQLADQLPERYTVYHGVHWTRVDGRHSIFGEVDFVIVNAAGKILLIEQKSGFLQETADGLVKCYGDKEKSVPAQMARSADHIRHKFSLANKGEKALIEVLLYCPDYKVKNPAAASIAPERIVDSSKRPHLALIIQQILHDDAPDEAARERAHRFFLGLIEVVPDVGALAGEAGSLFRRLSGGLAHWARQIECEPQRVRVIGTAGSGKTQLALALFDDAVKAGKRPLYVCFNRPLADHFAHIAPRGGEVATYHQLCDRALSAAGQRPDFTAPDAFPRMEAAFAALEPAAALRCDVLIMDEGQDFSAAWCEVLMRLLNAGGAAWWLEDPMQNLYERPPLPLPGWVTLRSQTNYRSPRDILRHLNALLPHSRTIEAGSPLDGSDVDILTYADGAELVSQTKKAIARAVGLGFKRDMIALITFRGRRESALSAYDQLGPHRLKHFTGNYDLFGSPQFSAGDVLIESVYRFKGQSMPCVILTEIDFETLDDKSLRKLFVGATRASMKLLLVLSDRAAKILLQRLD